MDIRHRATQTGSTTILTGLFTLLIVLAGCRSGPDLRPTRTPIPPTLAPTSLSAPVLPTAVPTPLPVLSLEETYAKEFVIPDFDAVHSPLDGDKNRYLIFGNIPVSKPAADLPAELADFLGRWEGYVYAPPVNKDRKLVLVIQEINEREGKAVGWSSTNLQYPDRLGDIRFRVIPGEAPSIEFQVLWPQNVREIDTFTYDRKTGSLRGVAKLAGDTATSATFELTQNRSFEIYKYYAKYLAGKRITPEFYQNSKLENFGKGYLLYLPEGYDEQPEKTWPLIFFLHGYGDRGDNLFLLAKASPFMFIREKGPLPAIIVAPLLTAFEGYSSFPEDYLDGVLAEIQSNYRVDPRRIYLTGLSMGGEAAYRFAVHQPKTFAALAPLSAYIDSKTYSMLDSLKDLPVWAIHGADDTLIPVTNGQQPVDALKAAGGKVKFSILAGHDHDTWTDTYSDPAFYDWLLQQQKP